MSDTTIATTTVAISELPAVGQPLQGGLFAGVTTRRDGAHCAVVLLTAKPAERLKWKAAMAWADDIDGALPTRPVAAMLFANLKSEFEEEWHWTSEEFDGSYAWYQYFAYGGQGSSHKSYEGRARAVRMIPLSS